MSSAELFTLEEHALEDSVDEGLQGGGGEMVLGSKASELVGVLLRLEPDTALADNSFAETSPACRVPMKSSSSWRSAVFMSSRAELGRYHCSEKRVQAAVWAFSAPR